MRLLLALASLVLATQAFAAGQVYKWTDDKGVVHYTDAPPEGRDFEKKKAVVKAPPAAQPAAPAQTGKTPEAAAKPAASLNDSNCTTARNNADSLKRFQEVKMDMDGDGEAEVLTPEQHAAELKRNEALMQIYCPPEGQAQ